jgi:hypothetical protein
MIETSYQERKQEGIGIKKNDDKKRVGTNVVFSRRSKSKSGYTSALTGNDYSRSANSVVDGNTLHMGPPPSFDGG